MRLGMALPNGPWIEHELGGSEVTWQIIIGKDTVPGWFALRNGAFIPVDVGQGRGDDGRRALIGL